MFYNTVKSKKQIWNRQWRLIINNKKVLLSAFLYIKETE